MEFGFPEFPYNAYQIIDASIIMAIPGSMVMMVIVTVMCAFIASNFRSTLISPRGSRPASFFRGVLLVSYDLQLSHFVG